MTDRSGLHQASGESDHSRSSRRSMGRSQGPFRSLNLGVKVGDDAFDVEGNRQELAEALGLRRIRFMDQIHSALCEVVSDLDLPESSVDATIMERRMDASNENAQYVGLAVQVADCVPVILSNEKAIMAVHIGREGLIKGMTEVAVDKFVELATKAGLVATIGPSICGRCYPLSREIFDSVIHRYPAANFDADSHRADVAAGVISVLEKYELRWEWFNGERECVCCNPAYFSYRRDGKTGRQAMVVAF